MILSLCLTCFTKNKEYASAQTTSVTTYYTFYIPYTQGLKSGNREYTSMLGTFQVNESGQLVSFTSYRAVGYDGNETEEPFNQFEPYVNEIVYDYNTGFYSTYVDMAFVNENNVVINSSCYINMWGSAIPYTAYWGEISAYESEIRVVFYNQNDLPVFTILYSVPYFNFVGYNYRFTPLIFVMQGSGDNYNLGYIQGVQDGYEDGYNTAVNDLDGDLSPLGVLVTNVNQLLKIDIFGNVSIGDLLSLSFGLIMLGLVIKIFLGG